MKELVIYSTNGTIAFKTQLQVTGKNYNIIFSKSNPSYAISRIAIVEQKSLEFRRNHAV